MSTVPSPVNFAVGPGLAALAEGLNTIVRSLMSTLPSRLASPGKDDLRISAGICSRSGIGMSPFWTELTNTGVGPTAPPTSAALKLVKSPDQARSWK